jgi:hypothetical protein
MGQIVGRHLRELLLSDPYRPRVGPVETTEQVQQRRLADSRRPDDGQHLPLPDLEIEAAEHHHRDLGIAVGLGEVAHLQEGHGAGIIGADSSSS